MKTLKKLAFSLLTASTLLWQAHAADSHWLTDAGAAQKMAKAEKKLVMMDFTGSDWCGWCIKLQKEVFSKKEFVAYAKTNLVLLEVDFPRNKKQTETLKKQNKQLQEKYGIEGYPTLIVLDAEGKKIGTLGYVEGGPKAFIAEVEKLKKQK